MTRKNPIYWLGIQGPWFSTWVFGALSILILGLSLMRFHGAPILAVAWLLAGLAMWTFWEYAFHLLFHRWKHAVTESHLTHHRVPFDTDYLVTRPWVIAGAGLLVFLLYLAAIRDLAAAGLMIAASFWGYLGYEWVHFSAHVREPGTRLGKYWKQYHLRHHFQDAGRGYGVTSPLWDYLCGTRIR